MKKCVTTDEICLGDDCQEYTDKPTLASCRREEIKDEQYLIQNLIDMIDDCRCEIEYLQKYSSKLSYAAQIINKNINNELTEILSVIQRSSLLIYEYAEKIIQSSDISELIKSFSGELKKWLIDHFLTDTHCTLYSVQVPSIVSDISTIEMALGVCMLSDVCEDPLESMFF